MRPIQLPAPPNPNTQPYAQSPFAWEQAAYQWMSTVRGILEQVGQQAASPATQPITATNFTTQTVVTGTYMTTGTLTTTATTTTTTTTTNTGTTTTTSTITSTVTNTLVYSTGTDLANAVCSIVAALTSRSVLTPKSIRSTLIEPLSSL